MPGPLQLISGEHAGNPDLVRLTEDLADVMRRLPAHIIARSDGG